jgi:hypothetical protein
MTDEQNTSGKLSDEDQAEYDRLEALEQPERDADEEAEQRYQNSRADGQDETDELGGSTAFDDSDPRRLADQDADERFPVRNAAAKWDDAATGGDTSRQKKSTYDTPWGRRELTHEEVVDLEHQGHVLTLVDDEPQTSLEQEKADMAHIRLTDDKN